MSSFLKTFLLEDVRRLSRGSARQVFLAAFGKHPGWDDYIEDIGMATESLLTAKQLLYIQGIRRQIDSGAWEKLEADQRVAGFAHVFLWYRTGQYLVGRLWSSADGKGRSHSPMVVCCHVVGLSPVWGLQVILPRLETIERDCKAATTADDVRALLTRHLDDLRVTAQHQETETISALRSVQQILDVEPYLGLGQGDERLLRVLYHLEGQMAAYAPGRATSRSEPAPVPSRQIRIPAAAGQPRETILFWARLLQSYLDPAMPVLFLVPANDPWLDVTVGEPSSRDLFCLRANSKALPLASEIPYQLDDAFRQRGGKFLAEFRNPQASLPVAAATGPPQSSDTSFMRRWFQGSKKWFGTGIVVLTLAAVATALVTKLPELQRTQPGSSTHPLARASPASVEPASPTSAPPAVAVTQAVRPGESPPASASRPSVAAPVVAQPISTAISRPAQSTPSEPTPPRPEPKPPTVTSAAPPSPKLPSQPPVVTPDSAAAPATKEVSASARSTPAPLGSAPGPSALTPAVSGSRPNLRLMTNSVGMELVWFPAGFWVDRYELTQAAYKQVTGTNSSRFNSDPMNPVERVSWNEALEFCKRLTDLERDRGTLPPGMAYTLPTEQQWEALLGDAKMADAVTSQITKRATPARVGSTGISNNYGLFDVLGNVWEWCSDKSTEGLRVAKGGGYNTLGTHYYKPMTNTTPWRTGPSIQFSQIGFRCILAPAQE